MMTGTTRWAYRYLAVAAGLAVSMAACGGGGGTDATQTDAAAAAGTGTEAGGETPNADEPMPGSVEVAGGASGGVYAVIAAALSELVNQHVDGVRAATTSTAAGLENVRLVRDGEATLGLVDPRTLVAASTGTREFSDEGAVENLRIVTTGFPGPFQVVVPQDSGIDSIADLKGQAICTSPGIQASFLEELLAGYDLTPEDVDVTQDELSSCAEALKEGNHAAMTFAGGAGAAGVIQAFSGGPSMKLVEIPAADASAINKEFPWWSAYEIEAGTYSGQGEPVATIMTPGGILFTNSDVSGAFVYELLSAIDSNLDSVIDAHPNMKFYALPESATNVIPDYIDWHEGALRYFDEQGIEPQ